MILPFLKIFQMTDTSFIELRLLFEAFMICFQQIKLEPCSYQQCVAKMTMIRQYKTVLAYFNSYGNTVAVNLYCTFVS